MEVVALVVALALGLLGFAALVGISSYATRRTIRDTQRLVAKRPELESRSRHLAFVIIGVIVVGLAAGLAGLGTVFIVVSLGLAVLVLVLSALVRSAGRNRDAKIGRHGRRASSRDDHR